MFIAASYLFGFAMFLGVFDRTGYSGPEGNLAFVIDHSDLFSLAIIVLYPLVAIALGILVAALRNRLAGNACGEIASVFGIAWIVLLFASGFVALTGLNAVITLAADDPDLALSTWTTISHIQNALGGGNELVGGVWMGLVSWLAMGSGQMPRPLAWLGMIIGGVGCLTIAPALADLVDIFGLGQIIWFAWLGIILLRKG